MEMVDLIYCRMRPAGASHFSAPPPGFPLAKAALSCHGLPSTEIDDEMLHHDGY
jgi:hypothetical protein